VKLRCVRKLILRSSRPAGGVLFSQRARFDVVHSQLKLMNNNRCFCSGAPVPVLGISYYAGLIKSCEVHFNQKIYLEVVRVVVNRFFVFRRIFMFSVLAKY